MMPSDYYVQWKQCKNIQFDPTSTNKLLVAVQSLLSILRAGWLVPCVSTLKYCSKNLVAEIITQASNNCTKCILINKYFIVKLFNNEQQIIKVNISILLLLGYKL